MLRNKNIIECANKLPDRTGKQSAALYATVLNNYSNKLHNRISILFLLLILAHAIHATEEYVGKLWEIYTPAIFICNLISSNPEKGFLIINSLFIIISLVYRGFSIRKNQPAAYPLLWIWIVLQTVNVIGHIAWTISTSAYTPGIVSALLILLLVILLIKQISAPHAAAGKRNKA